MTAFLSRLFRRHRVYTPAWIEVVELERRLAAGEAVVLVDVRNWSAASRPARPLSLSMCVSPRNLPRPRATCLVLSTCHWPICRAGSENLLRGDNRSCWFARPIADPPRRRRSYSPRAYGMSPSFVAEQTGGIGMGGRSNSVGVTADD